MHGTAPVLERGVGVTAESGLAVAVIPRDALAVLLLLSQQNRGSVRQASRPRPLTRLLQG